MIGTDHQVARTSLSPQYLTLPCGSERLVVLREAEYLLLEACRCSFPGNKMPRRAPLDELPNEVQVRIANGTAPVRAVREWRGLKGSQLARLVGITRSMLSQIECSNASMSVKTLYALARTLSVTMETLIFSEKLVAANLSKVAWIELSNVLCAADASEAAE